MKEAAWVRRVFPVALNHRGRPVGVWLGTVFTGGLVIGLGAVHLASIPGGIQSWERRLLWILAGMSVVFLAGLYDDYRPARTRGVVAQVRVLGHGRISPGVVKLGAIVVAAGLVAWALDGRGGRLWLGIPVIAGASNLWNLLDVVPGRALKWFAPTQIAVTVAAGTEEVTVLGISAVVLAVIVLALDLREVAMLGDQGSNVLGYIVGVGLFESLPIVGLAVALAALMALHALSETVTLSRIIRAVPPLRWFDDLGRIEPPSEQHSGQSSA